MGGNFENHVLGQMEGRFDNKSVRGEYPCRLDVASGVHGVKIPQRLLGVTVDGIVGPKTIAAVNARNPRELFDMIKIARFDFIEDICRKRPANNKFKRGWMNRINDLKFES